MSDDKLVERLQALADNEVADKWGNRRAHYAALEAERTEWLAAIKAATAAAAEERTLAQERLDRIMELHTRIEALEAALQEIADGLPGAEERTIRNRAIRALGADR